MIIDAVRRAHPLHALRKLRLFQWVSSRFDPLLPRRFPGFAHPIYLRALSHASIICGGWAQEDSVKETFAAVLGTFHRTDDGCFWDVGANVGYFSFVCAATQSQWSIASFEPDPGNLECLRMTSARWRLPRHTIVPAAVAGVTGRTAFLRDKLSGATGTIETSAQSFNDRHYGYASERIEVETVSLDDFLKASVNPPLVVKIDVEGAELAVFDGASQLILQHSPIFFFESFEHRPAISALLQRHGYRLFDADHRTGADEQTINFVALVPSRWPGAINALQILGYPV